MTQFFKYLAVAGLLARAVTGAEQPAPPADLWLTNAAPFPSNTAAAFIRSNVFAGLRAETLVGRLKVLWTPSRFSSNALVTLHVSADEPGHWPARDWRTRPMTARAGTWEVAVPVEDVDLPLVYFVSALDDHTTNLSPMRLCLPRALGLEASTRIFWPFLEGFEEGMESWRLLSNASGGSFTTNATAKNGLAALAVSLAAGQRTVTVGTTRVRGVQARRELATGLRLWVRTRTGQGRARFQLLTQAFTPNQNTSAYPTEVELGPAWQKVDLSFSGFPNLSVPAIDFFTIEFIGEGPRDFLLDDLQLLGPWKLEPP